MDTVDNPHVVVEGDFDPNGISVHLFNSHEDANKFAESGPKRYAYKVSNPDNS